MRLTSFDRRGRPRYSVLAHSLAKVRRWWCIGVGSVLVFSLAQLAGAGQVSSPQQTPPAKKPAYVIFTREHTRDAAELKSYSQKSPASLTGRTVELLAVYGRQEVLEGSQVEGVVVLRFPSFEDAKTWYDSPEYREARKHRFAGADYRAVIVEGR